MEPFTTSPPPSYSYSLWRIAFGIFFLITVLLLSTSLVCGFNEACRSRIPTVGHLLTSSFAAPYLVTAINAFLSLHLCTALGLRLKTKSASPQWSSLQLGMAVLVYIGAVITLFVFPFTDWDRNWANLVMVVAFFLWMLTVILSLRSFHTKHYFLGRRGFRASIVLCVVYASSAIAYIVVRAVGEDVGVLVCELAGGAALVFFLVMGIAHISDLEIRLKFKNG